MPRRIIAFHACWIVLLVCASLSEADGQQHPKPLGVYAHVDIEYALQGCNPCSQEQQLSYLSELYTKLLGNQAISGLAVGIHWDKIQLSSPNCYNNCVSGTDANGNSWIFLEGVFAAVEAAAKATGADKSVQLIITPGVDSPSWLLLPDTKWWCAIRRDPCTTPTCPCVPVADPPPLSCDKLFTGPGAPADCGKVTFAKLPEEQRADPHGGPWQLPLPWNSAYQFYWGEFLKQVNAQYGGKRAFVSIAVAGPNGASTEMVLPTTANGSFQSLQNPTEQADDAWSKMIAHDFQDKPKYQDTDEVFIDNWTQTIKVYEQYFPDVTLVLTSNDGEDLPAFPWNTTMPHHPGKEKLFDKMLFEKDCSQAIQEVNNGTPFTKTDYRSCEAKAEILSRFLTLGDNAKATQVGGMRASSPTCTGDIGLPGVKLLTPGSSLASPPLIGGAAFDYAVSGTGKTGEKLRNEEGCPPEPSGTCWTTKGPAPNCTVSIEEAAYNALTNFFYGTPSAPDFGGPCGGILNIQCTATIQYVQVDFEDVLYANHHPPPIPPLTISCKSSLQYLLDIASYDLFTMAGQPPPVQKPNCSSP